MNAFKSLIFIATIGASTAQLSQYGIGSGGAGSGIGFGGSGDQFGAASNGNGRFAPAPGSSGPLDPIAALEEALPGVPGQDYPILAEVPQTSFTCEGKVEGGYYADPQAECQAFHICAADAEGGLAQYSFLCPNGTIFNQNYFICDWWFNFDCAQAEALYSRNEEVAAEREAASGGAGGSFGGSAGGSFGGSNGGRLVGAASGNFPVPVSAPSPASPPQASYRQGRFN